MQQVTEKRLAAHFVKIKEMIEKMMMSKIEENVMPASIIHPVPPPSQIDWDNVDLPTPAIDKNWVQTKLGYYNLYLDLSHSKDELVTLGREIHYCNVILFV